MDKYKINYIFSEEENINDIFIRVLNRELLKYIQIICKNENRSFLSSDTYLSFKEGENS